MPITYNTTTIDNQNNSNKTAKKNHFQSFNMYFNRIQIHSIEQPSTSCGFYCWINNIITFFFKYQFFLWNILVIVKKKVVKQKLLNWFLTEGGFSIQIILTLHSQSKQFDLKLVCKKNFYFDEFIYKNKKTLWDVVWWHSFLFIIILWSVH